MGMNAMYNELIILLHDYWIVSIYIRRDIKKNCPMCTNFVDIEMQLINDYGTEKSMLFKNCRKLNLNFPNDDVRQWSIFHVQQSPENKSLIFTFASLQKKQECKAQLSFIYDNY